MYDLVTGDYLEDSISTAKRAANKMLKPNYVKRDRKLLPQEIRRRQDINKLPCSLCFRKHSCQHECLIFRSYVCSNGVFATSTVEVKDAIKNLAKHDLRVYNFIIGEPI